MKIKVKQQTEVEIEIKLPAFYKSSAYWYKVISENEYISVLDFSSGGFEIRMNNYAQLMVNFILTDEANTPCTEQEFIDAYMHTKDIINDVLPDVEDEYDPEISIRTDNWGSPGSTEYNLKLKNETK